MIVNFLRFSLVASFVLSSMGDVSASRWKSILEDLEREKSASTQAPAPILSDEDDITPGNAGVPLLDPEDTHNDEAIAQMVAEEELAKLRSKTQQQSQPEPQPQPKPQAVPQAFKKSEETLNDEAIAKMMAEEEGNAGSVHGAVHEDLDAYKNLNLTEEEQMQLLQAQFGIKVDAAQPVDEMHFDFPLPIIKWTPEDHGVIDRLSKFFASQAEVDVHGVNKQIHGADQNRMLTLAQNLVKDQEPVSLPRIQEQAKAQFDEIYKLSQLKLPNGQPVMTGNTVPNFQATMAHMNDYFQGNRRDNAEIQVSSQELLFTAYRLSILVDKLLNHTYGENVNRLIAKGLFENEMTGGGCYQGYMGRIFKDMCQSLQDVNMLTGPKQ